MYLPEEYLNENYTYYLNGNNILILTNRNCYTNYNTSYCDCITYNPEMKIITEARSCNTNQNLYEINSNTFIEKDIYNIWNIIPFVLALLFFIALMIGVRK